MYYIAYSPFLRDVLTIVTKLIYLNVLHENLQQFKEVSGFYSVVVISL